MGNHGESMENHGKSDGKYHGLSSYHIILQLRKLTTYFNGHVQEGKWEMFQPCLVTAGRESWRIIVICRVYNSQRQLETVPKWT